MTKVKKLDTHRSETNHIKSAIKRLYSKSAPLLLCEAILFGAVAVFMIIKPVEFMTVLTIIIGVALILFGLYRAIVGFIASRGMGGGWFDVLFGLVNVVLGFLFCIYPVGSMISLTYVFVVLFFFKAIRVLIFAINMVRAKFGHYWFDLIMALLLLGLAVLLMFFPMAVAVAGAYYLAIALILYAAADIYMYVELVRLKKLV